VDAQRDDEDERTEDGRVWRRCLDCAEPFYISAAAQQGFALRGYPLTRRCWSCRQRRRLERELADYEQER
jgi:hypothetical protein